jgi:protein Mpv17
MHRVAHMCRYINVNKRRPVLTQSLTAGAIGIVGDFIMQSLELRWAREEAAAAAAGGIATGAGNSFNGHVGGVSGGAAVGPAVDHQRPADSRWVGGTSGTVDARSQQHATSDSKSFAGSAGAGASSSTRTTTTVASNTRSDAGAPVGEMDWRRTGNMVIYRMFIFGPIFSTFIRKLEAVVPWTGWRGVVAKVAVDQLIFQPPILCVFYASLATLEGRSLSDAVDRAKTMLWPTLQLNVPFWTTVHCVTFSVIPVQHRVAWVSLIQCAWSAVMSGLNKRAATGKPPLPLGVDTVAA